MNPKRAKDLSKEVAKELNVDPALVTDLTDFVWNKVQSMLSNLEFTHLEILNLGHFRIKKWKLEDTRKKYERLIPDYVPTTFQQAARINSAKERLAKIEKLIQISEKEEAKKLIVKNKRNGK